MKSLIICILVFMFCGIVMVVVHLHESESHSHLSEFGREKTSFYKLGKRSQPHRGPAAQKTEHDELAGQHFKKFLKLLSTDPETARMELDSYATIHFQNHPLTEEWKKLCFRIIRDKGALVPDMLRFIELRREMLIDKDPTKYAREVEGLVFFLSDLKMLAKKFERQGILETKKIPFNLKLAE